jgi:hypothetical protein
MEDIMRTTTRTVGSLFATAALGLALAPAAGAATSTGPTTLAPTMAGHHGSHGSHGGPGHFGGHGNGRHHHGGHWYGGCYDEYNVYSYYDGCDDDWSVTSTDALR